MADEIRLRSEDLPWLGQRYEIDVQSGMTVVVIESRSGRERQLLVRRPEADEVDVAVDLTPGEAVVIGNLLAGVRVRPEEGPGGVG